MKDGKIVVATLLSRYEGLVFFMSPIILGLEPQKYQAICVYLTKDSEKPNFFEEKGRKVFYISRKKFIRMFNLWVIWKLSRVLKCEKVDILHCHRHKPTVYGTIAATLAHTPVIISHVHGISRTRNLKRKIINFLILKKVNKIITVGKAVKEDVLKTNPFVQPDKVVPISNSINYEQYAKVSLTKSQVKERIDLPQDSFVFGTVGRLAPTKGQTYLIRAFEKVKQQIPSAHLVFIGDGRLRNQLQEQAAKTATDSIHFLGHRNEIPELLKAMDVFVLPSIAEGLPVSLLEAMAAGVPCVATKVGGIPEIINGEYIGLLVAPRDSGALADAMLRVTNMLKQERRKVIQKAQSRVCRFYSHEIVREKLVNLYENELRACVSND